MIFQNPVRGVIHGAGWTRPAGNRDFRLTQDFGPSSLAIEPTVVWKGGEGIPAGTYPNFHRGIDLGNGGCGADVIAAGPGRVDFAGIDGTNNRVVIIDHGSAIRTWYGHLQDEVVSVGQNVTTGHLLGHVGKQAATACHLHWAIEVSADGHGTYEWVDGWRRLVQNVTVRLDPEDGVNVRSTAGSGTTKGPLYASTKGGRLIRTDGIDLGPSSAPRRWAGTVTGASYPAGSTYPAGNRWETVECESKWRYVASPLAVVSQR